VIVIALLLIEVNPNAAKVEDAADPRPIFHGIHAITGFRRPSAVP